MSFIEQVKEFQPQSLDTNMLDAVERAIENDTDILFDAIDNKIDLAQEGAEEESKIESESEQKESQKESEQGVNLTNKLNKSTGDKLRQNLLRKLTYEKIWLTPQEKPKMYETAIIFDWDDTLLCTSFINPSGVYQHVELGPVVQQHIKVLEGKVKQ